MRLTNKLGLPEAVVRAVANDSYTKGEADISVTELLSPPQLRRLRLQHYAELEEDVADRVPSLRGQAFHVILERAAAGNPDMMIEKSVYSEYAGWKIKGQVDHVLISSGELIDFKETSARKVRGGVLPREWEQQTNIYRRMLQREKGLQVRAIAVFAFLKDWSKRESRQSEDYPQKPVVRFDVPLWTDEQADAFIEERVRLHQMAEPIACSEEDVWARPDKWAVMKRGNVKAIRLYNNPLDADLHARQSAAFYVEHRQGEAIRCKDWCQVSHLCPQWATDPRNQRVQSVAESLFNAEV
jgi:hypothetical protein